ncbi:uncharacterized protein LOC120650861 isoform X1 [Panicum virgatum]|uniref:uncharacterized protein LOC120650861 isoform X1 n=1 Tax=Panicum virgatum TaxID=38727 RepID=UPI0019D5C717|nr:uncharacterized protein LOC120650861 isoform X1 [Panicum virgatum]
MAERKRKRAAEEWERRKRGRRRRMRRREGEGLGKRQVGWAGDPVEALGEEVMGRVMELLDARSVARCTAVSRAWRGVAADDRLWAPKINFILLFVVIFFLIIFIWVFCKEYAAQNINHVYYANMPLVTEEDILKGTHVYSFLKLMMGHGLCAELMAGKAHIPRLTSIRTGSKLSTYSMAIMDGKRSRITKEDLCDHAWEYRFTIAAPEYWRNLDPSWKHTGPPMRRYFHPDGYHSADPHDAVWGGHECAYTVITSFVGDGQIRDHYVRINRWPPLKVSRKDDWSWELSNHLYRYNSIPDADKKGCTGPLFPVW